jgi:hypothetical protein
MIIAPKFTLLNFPKTGSTFVRAMIQNAEQRRGHVVGRIDLTRKKGKIDYALWLIGFRDYDIVRLARERLWKDQPSDEHGGVSQIPWGFRRRPVACVIRHPLDRIVSEYHFRWYAKYPDGPVEAIRSQIPSFPDMTFETYLEYLEFFRGPYLLRNAGVDDTIDIGCQTIDFVRQLFWEPKQVLTKLSDSFVESGEFRKYMPDILHLMNTRTLNQDLADFMRLMGYSKEVVSQVRHHEKVQPGPGTQRTAQDDWQSHYTEPLMNRILHRERFLFQILSHLGLSYDVKGATS